MIEKDWLKKTARLSRLKLTEEEISEFIPQLQSVLDHVDELTQLGAGRAESLAGVEPWIHPLLELLPNSSAFREDHASASPLADGLIAGAPESVERAFQVPQAVTQDQGAQK